MKMKILLATSNPHKLEEILAIWSDMPWDKGTPLIELVGLDTVDPKGHIHEPIEDGDTFEDNAVLKARHYAKATGMLTMADDSGLAVDALAGQPGVRSARYAGVNGPRSVVDPANNKLLLQELAGVPAQHRTARFVCVMALVAPADSDAHEPLPLKHVVAPDPDGRVLGLVRGTIEGRIIELGENPRGDHGFGYDPLFFVPHLGKTTAELTPPEKNAISHRGQAARLMYKHLCHNDPQPAD